MFKITCFADEISSDFQTQIEVVKKQGLKYVELRSAWDINILDLNLMQLSTMKRILDENSIKVSCIGSPIGKVFIEDSFDEHLEKFIHGLELAHFFGCDYMRIFSFYSRTDIKQKKDEVLNKLQLMVNLAKEEKVTLVHENETMIYGDTSIQCLELAKEIEGDNFGLVLDPANYLIAGERPFDDSFMRLNQYIKYVHVKDYSTKESKMVYVGQGDGQFDLIFTELKNRELFLSLEPHLDVAGQFRGFTGEKKFIKDCDCLKALLREHNIEFE